MVIRQFAFMTKSDFYGGIMQPFTKIIKKLVNKIEKLIQLRNDMYSWAKIELVGTKIINDDSKIEILINNKGLKHTLKGKSYKNKEMIE